MRAVKTLYNRECRYYDLPSTKLQLERYILRTSTTKDNPKVWIDDCSGPVSLEGAIFPLKLKIDQQGVNHYPCGFFLEKVNEFGLCEDRKVSLQEPEHNILTKECINV
jgi:hypothetical protein